MVPFCNSTHRRKITPWRQRIEQHLLVQQESKGAWSKPGETRQLQLSKELSESGMLPLLALTETSLCIAGLVWGQVLVLRELSYNICS